MYVFKDNAMTQIFGLYRIPTLRGAWSIDDSLKSLHGRQHSQKKEELKRRGMQMILVVHLRKANDTGRKMAGKGNTTKVTTSPTASTEDDPYAY